MKVAVGTDGICPNCHGSVLDSGDSAVERSVPREPAAKVAPVPYRGKMPGPVIIAAVLYAIIILGFAAVITKFQFDIIIAVFFLIVTILVIALAALLVRPSWAWSFNIFVQVVLVVLSFAFGILVLSTGISAIAGLAVLAAPVSLVVFVTSRFVTDERVRRYLGR
jgi:hypothetical protein